MNRGLLGAAGIIIIGAIIWYVVAQKAPTTPATQGSATSTPSYTWNMTDIGEHPSAPGIPRTGVTLTVNGTTHPIGEFNGNCSEIKGSGWTLQPGEVSGIICWWAGGGDEVGIFSENGQTVVKQGVLDEGSAETPGVRGGYKTILTL